MKKSKAKIQKKIKKENLNEFISIHLSNKTSSMRDAFRVFYYRNRGLYKQDFMKALNHFMRQR